MAPACPDCGSSERVSRVTDHQTMVKCGSCGKIHSVVHTLRPDFFGAARLRAESKTHPHYFISVMLAFFAVAAILLFTRLL